MRARTTDELTTPALLVDASSLEFNLRTMKDVLPGPRLRPHVKAHKCTNLARRQSAAGHSGFTCATLREMEGMIAAGLGDYLLLANQSLDFDRLRRLNGRGIIAVDSMETIDAAAKGAAGGVLIEVNVGLNRCGCCPNDAPRLADVARRRGLQVRGVMGYEGQAAHVQDPVERQRRTTEAMDILTSASVQVGGSIISAGSTGTFRCNSAATEIQAGSYALMDSAYARIGLPFRQALFILATVISVGDGRAVADCGLKAMGMDEGPPSIPGSEIVAIHDEHLIFNPEKTCKVGDRIRIIPAHIDPTMAYHEVLYVVQDERVLDRWAIDLRGWADA